MTILQCTSLSKHYGKGEELVKALEGVSLSLEQGSFTAITGPSGSGKSTLLHMLGGLDRPTEGSVQFRDKDLYRLRDDQLAILRRRQFGFVFQSYNLVRELTGMENILLPLMLDKRSPDEAYLNRLIDILGIGSRRLRELNRELGITLVLVTHDLGVAEQAQRVIHLTDGKIARDSGGVQL